MCRIGIVFTLFVLNACGILLAQQGGADPAQRYFRLICLVHLTGSGQAGDPVVPEYVVQGTAVAQAAVAAAASGQAGHRPVRRPRQRRSKRLQRPVGQRWLRGLVILRGAC